MMFGANLWKRSYIDTTGRHSGPSLRAPREKSGLARRQMIDFPLGDERLNFLVVTRKMRSLRSWLGIARAVRLPGVIGMTYSASSRFMLGGSTRLI